MKKQKIQLLLLCVVLALCVGGYFAAKQIPKEETNVISDEHTVLNVKKEDVIEISYFYDGEIIDLVKNEEEWYAKDNSETALNQSQIETMLGYVCNITTDTVIESPEMLANYGLSNPSNTICLTLEDESVVQLLIGDCMSITGDYYALLAGDSKVYTISSYIVTSFQKSLDDLIDESAGI